MQLPFSGTRAVFLSLICAGVLSILGVFGLQVREVGAAASLTTPTTVISGTQYGEDEDLGKYNIEAWSAEPQYYRRMLYVQLPSGQEVLFVAFVNNAAGGTCSGTTCKLEFKYSYDKGLNWAQPILGSTQSLAISDSDNNGANGAQYEYTLALSPDTAQPDIWVSLVQSGDSAVIRKLTWTDSPAGWTISNTTYTPSGCTLPCTEKAAVAVGIQQYGVNTVITGAVEYGVGGTTNAYRIVACNTSTDCTVRTNWLIKRQTQAFGSGAINKPGPVKIVFVPLVKPGEASQMLAAVLMIPRQYHWNSVTNICDASANPGGFIYTQTDDIGTWSAGPQATIDAYPLYNIRQNTCAAVDKPVTKPFTFTLAAFNSSASAATLMVGWEGGATSANEATSHAGKVTVAPFQVSLTNGALTGSSSQTITGTYYAPALSFAPKVGETSVRAWLAMRDGTTESLAIADSAISPFSFSPVQVYLGSVYSPIGSILNPSTPGYIPYNGTTPYTLNSELPPVAWTEYTAGKISFSANSGGNLFGWGWSSNFGWLSLNCANTELEEMVKKGLLAQVCLFPYGVKVKEPPTAPLTLGSPPYSSPQQSNSGNASLLSALSPQGYPLSGFAWSSNAGWFTFDRTYSAYSCVGCDPVPDTNPTQDDNPVGNPPAQDYRRNAGTSTDPIAKYVPGTQRIHGWGRFLNLCNFVSGKCQDKDGGWVRMRGFWINNITPKRTNLTADIAANATSLPVASCADFSSPGVALIGAEFFTFTCAANTISITGDHGVIFPYSSGKQIDNVTNQTYGVDGYWSGSRYEVSGWAWSAEYGWIHFRPTLFAGFAWLETLFGNIYTSGYEDSLGNLQGGSIQLPNPQDAAGTQLDSCDTNGDGTANEPCYTATYRIEAGGDITTLTVPGTGQNGGFASSAIIDYIQTLIDPVTGQPYKILNTPSAGALDPYVSRSLPIGQAIPFPTVSPDSTTFRNALGKIDIGALTTFVGTPEDENHSPSHVKYGKDNRLGNELIKTDQGVLGVVTWNLSDLVGYAPASGSAQLWASLPLNTIRNQVIHVQGDLEMLPSDDAQTTITSNYAAGAVTMQVANTVNFPKSGYLIVNAGTSTEEYFRYTAVPDGTHFSLTSLRTPALAHASGQSVRWAWKLPDSVAADGKADTATIVVDGDLNIQYNIISQTPSGITDIKQVPTFAFIVRGNVNIAKEVNRVDSAFIVLSRDSTKVPGTNCVAPDLCSPYTHWGGVFDTGDDVSLCDPVTKKCNPLKIKGMLFARQFNFLRVGDQNLESPGEQVTFDSNLLLNPPPGLGDLTKALPRITRINQ